MMNVNLVSGGIDSTMMAYENFHSTNVFFNYGQPYVNEERKALQSLGFPFIEVPIGNTPITEQDKNFVNDRNLTFASVASMLFNADVIRIAGVKDDVCVDKSPEAFEMMSQILTKFSRKKVTVLSPYWHLTKGELVQKAINYGIKDMMQQTFSCYNPVNGVPCGHCSACFRKFVALESNGIEAGFIPSSFIIRQYLQRIDSLPLDRINRIFISLKRHFKFIAIDIDEAYEKKDTSLIPISHPIKEWIEEEKRLVIFYTSKLEWYRDYIQEWLNDNQIYCDALLTGNTIKLF